LKLEKLDRFYAVMQRSLKISIFNQFELLEGGYLQIIKQILKAPARSFNNLQTLWKIN